jgi:hypothetical protein
MKILAYIGLVIIFGSTYDALRTIFYKNKISKIISEKSYNTVVGDVLFLHISGKYSHKPDHFKIKDIDFKVYSFVRSAYDNALIYAKTKKTGGAIRENGQKVKIHYIALNGENKIIKMWVYPENDSNSSLSKAPTR